MTKFEKIVLFLLRISMGWLMFYAGITKVLNPAWSSVGYLQEAKTFSTFYQYLSGSGILPTVDFVNEWGLTLLGISLILGVFVRLSSVAGAVLMVLYYLPVLDFPYPNAHSYIIDDHIIYALVLLYFASIKAGRFWGLENKITDSKFFYPFRGILG